MKPVWVRPLADHDVDAHADHIAQDNLNAALRFLDAVQAGYDQISSHSHIGSARYAHLIAGLRFWLVPDFENYLVFYLDHPDAVEVLRVLHGSRDIPAILQQ